MGTVVLLITSILCTLSGKAEVDGIAKFLLEMNDRWKNVSVELRCIQSLLEEVITYWKKFLELTQQFEVWLDRASAMIGLPEEDKMDFFQVRQACCIYISVYQFIGLMPHIFGPRVWPWQKSLHLPVS